MDSKLIVENLFRELNIPDDKPFSEWIKHEFSTIQNGIGVYFDTLTCKPDELNEQIVKLRREYKREIEQCEKYNLDFAKPRVTDLINQLNEIVNKFENDLRVNGKTDLTEFKNDLKLFREKLFPKTCLFCVSKSNDYKLIVLSLDTTNDIYLRNLIKYLLKRLIFMLPDKNSIINLTENSFLIKLLKYRIQIDKELQFNSDDKWKSEDFLRSLSLAQTKEEPAFKAKLDKFLAYISNWLTQVVFTRSTVSPEELNLVSDSINSEAYFNGFYSSETLNLFYLTFDSLKEGFFAKFKNLKSLDLSETKLDELPNSMLQSLIFLNKLKIGKSSKRLVDNNYVKLGSFLFEFLVSLTSLDLISIELINYKTFTGLSKLETLSLENIYKIESESSFKQLRNLKSLTIKDTFLDLNEKLFHGLISLNVLNLSFNPLVNLEEETLIEANPFVKLTNLTSLNIEFHNIPVISQEIFTGLTKLKNLQLRGNRIELVESYSFCDLLSLEVLDLSDNRIQAITSDMFYGLINIKKLILKKNELEYIEPGLFDINLSSLNELNLSGNNLIAVTADIFVEMSNLKSLSLGNNQIDEIEINAFEKLTSLDTLLLNGNKLESLSREIFNGIDGSLKHLNLAQNQLSSIEKTAFSSLKSLEFLALTENKLESLDRELFNGLIKLKKLDLDLNKFSYDKETCDLLFRELDDLETIVIEHKYHKRPILALEKYVPKVKNES